MISAVCDRIRDLEDLLHTLISAKINQPVEEEKHGHSAQQGRLCSGKAAVTLCGFTFSYLDFILLW